MEQPFPGLAELTAAPRLYGFHATLRPPMRLASGWEDFLGAAVRVSGSVRAFPLPRLEVAGMDGFLALRETIPCPALQDLADAAIAQTNACRLPAGEAELARRRAAGLSAEEDALLLAWGYPYVFQRWRFHMTLSRRLSEAEMALWRPLADAHFSAALARQRWVEDVTIFAQRAPGERFLVADRVRLGT